jgi:hypothetical protein
MKAQNSEVTKWCRRRDSNPHRSPRHPLKMVCLPIPPRRHYIFSNNMRFTQIAPHSCVSYFVFAGAGAGVTGAGVGIFCSIGACCRGATFTILALLYIIARTKLVNINRTTTTDVIRVIKLDVPELPKRVWLAPLPKAAPISDPRPVCKRTMNTKAMADKIWTIVIPVSIVTYPKQPLLYSRSFQISRMLLQ